MTHRWRQLLIPALVLGALAVPMPAAAAEVHTPFCFDAVTGASVPSCTYTATLHGVVSVDTANVNPCSGVVGTATTITNSVVHITVNAAGDLWITGTSTSHFTFVPNAPNASGAPSYRGEMTFWFGDSLNKNNSVMHDAGNIVLTGSDGSQITYHVVDHLSVSASGIVQTFSILRTTCP
jgi:hypothetical protein